MQTGGAEAAMHFLLCKWTARPEISAASYKQNPSMSQFLPSLLQVHTWQERWGWNHHWHTFIHVFGKPVENPSSRCSVEELHGATQNPPEELIMEPRGRSESSLAMQQTLERDEKTSVFLLLPLIPLYRHEKKKFCPFSLFNFKYRAFFLALSLTISRRKTLVQAKV